VKPATPVCPVVPVSPVKPVDPVSPVGPLFFPELKFVAPINMIIFISYISFL
jgi:hypothetical protein